MRESDLDYGVAWRRLHSTVVDIKARDVMFLLLHNKLLVEERLFRIGLKPDPYCLRCPQAEISDVTHFFCGCEAVSNSWSWVKRQVVRLGRMGQGIYISIQNLKTNFIRVLSSTGIHSFLVTL